MKDQTNPLLCDPQSGVCGIPKADSVKNTERMATKKPVRIIYYTDPICSSCWGIEPQLRKLKLAYGTAFEIEYRMGGLLPDWSYNNGGISKPSDVAQHWDEMGQYYDMPLDGDVWLEDPLHSSYPPSIAYVAARLQDAEKAQVFLRELKEMVFLRKQNITKWEVLAEAAQTAGLDPLQLKKDVEGQAKTLFENDLKLSREAGVRGFPTIFVVGESGQQEIVYGSKPYEDYVAAIQKVYPAALEAMYPSTWEYLFSKFNTLTTKEYSVLSGKSKAESEQHLAELNQKGILEKTVLKNGALWRRKP